MVVKRNVAVSSEGLCLMHMMNPMSEMGMMDMVVYSSNIKTSVFHGSNIVIVRPFRQVQISLFKHIIEAYPFSSSADLS